MDKEGQERIRTLLQKVLGIYTVCSAKFLNALHEKGILSLEEVGLIAQKGSDSEKGDLMYELIRGRNNSYPILIQGLNETGQEDIVQLLERGWIPLRLLVKARMRKYVGEGESESNIAQLTVNWNIAIAEISQLENGIRITMILYQMAYLFPDKINPEILQHCKWAGSQADLEAGFRLLVQFGLLPNEVEQGILSIHPRIQQVTRNSLAAKSEESTMLEEVFHMLLDQSAQPGEGILPPENLKHILVAWEHAWKYPSLIQKFSFAIPWTVLRLHESGRDEEAVAFGDDAVEKLTPVLSQDHMDVLVTLRITGKALLHQGRFNEALSIVRYLMKRQKAIFGESHPETIGSMSTLATIYASVGNPEEALKLLQKVSEEQTQKLSEHDPELLQTRQTVAITLGGMGRSLEALEIFEDIYLKLKMFPGPNKVLLLSVRSYLGQCFTSLGKFHEALEVLQEDYLEVEELSGAERICMNEVISSIGDVFWNLENYDGALEKHQHVHEEFLLIFGKEHPRSLLCKRKIAIDLSWMGRHSEAINLLQGALNQMESLFGEDGYELLRWKVLLVMVMAREGKNIPKALGILEQIKAKLLEKGGKDSPNFKEDVWNCVEWIERDISSKSSLQNMLETIISYSQDVRFHSI